MLEPRPLHRSCVALGRRAGASLVLASLLALFLGQPLHARAPIAAVGDAPSSLALVASPPSALHGAHDADLCSLCRATAQTRLGLRVAQRAGEITAGGASLPLHLPALTPAKAAPQLREAQPRGPPRTLSLLPA
jgi:hypothetical protein